MGGPIDDTDGAEKDAITAATPSCRETVTVASTEPPMPLGVRQSSDVSETHADAAHAVWTRARTVESSTPKPRPNKVTDEAPVLGTSPLIEDTVGGKLDTATARGDSCIPTELTRANEAPTECGVKQITAVVETQRVDSHAVDDIRDRGV